MEIGTHDPRYQARMASEYGITLVSGPDGGLVRPDYRPERSRPDDDRDGEVERQLAALYRHIDRRVADYRRFHGVRSAQKQIAEDIISAWESIREITG